MTQPTLACESVASYPKTSTEELNQSGCHKRCPRGAQESQGGVEPAGGGPLHMTFSRDAAISRIPAPHLLKQGQLQLAGASFSKGLACPLSHMSNLLLETAHLLLTYFLSVRDADIYLSNLSPLIISKKIYKCLIGGNNPMSASNK